MPQVQVTDSQAEVPKIGVLREGKAWVAIAFLVSLCLCAWGLVRSGTSLQRDDSVTRLMLAVSRLMLADELGVGDEVQRASDLLEQAVADRDSMDPLLDSKDVNEVFRLAGLVRDHLEKSDRKASVETFLDFKNKAEALDSKVYRIKSQNQAFGLNGFMMFGLLGLLGSLGVLWWLFEQASHSRKELQEDAQQAREELLNAKFRFEEEQRRSIELQQRLMETGKSAKKMESTLDEYTHALSQLESGVKYLKANLAESESRLKSLDSEYKEATKLRQEADLKISSMQALLNASEQTESALQSRLVEMQNEKEAQYVELTSKISELLSQIEAMPLEPNRETSDSSNGAGLESTEPSTLSTTSLLPDDLQKLQSEMIQERARIQSEFAVIEWSNTKLKAEIVELKAELDQAKAALLDHEKESRERMLALQESLNVEKARALDEAKIQFEGEVKFLRDQLRSASDPKGQRSA